MTKRVKEPFKTVYEKYFPDIYNFIYAQLLHRERTEDLVSDIFIKAMANYDRYDPERASVRTWLTNIARNALIDEYRKSSIRNHASLDDENNNLTEPSYEDEYQVLKDAENQEVYEILSHLKDSERELIGLIYFQNMKNEQVGEILGINAKAVSERHRRVLAKCRIIAEQIFR